MIISRQKEYGLLSFGSKLISTAGQGLSTIGHSITKFGLVHPILASLGLGYLAYRHYKKRKQED